MLDDITTEKEPPIKDRDPLGHNKTMNGNLTQAYEQLREMSIDPDHTTVIIDPHVSSKFFNISPMNLERSPCITRTKGEQRLWISSRRQVMSMAELCRFQGMDIHRFEAARRKTKMSDSSYGAAIGNSMNVKVLESLLPTLACSTGLIKRF